MKIDRLNDITPNYESSKSKPSAQDTTVVTPKDHVDISKEASRAAELDYITKIVRSTEEPDRIEKLQQVREKLANNEYDQLSKDQLDTITNSLVRTFFA